MRSLKIKDNPYLLFLPFLLLYIFIVWWFPTKGIEGDEPRYLHYAANLLKGYYSLPYPDVDISNGPGYPLILAPFLWFKAPLVYVSLLNAVLQYLSIILLYKSLRKIVSYRSSIIFSLIWAFNFNIYSFIPLVLTEILSSFIITFIIYSTITAFKTHNEKESNVYLILSAVSFGYLILTKTIFFYVLIMMMIFYGLLWLIKLKRFNYQKSAFLLIITFLTILPYLYYTYSLTNRVFFVTNKSSNIYWMSTPYENEYGDWFETPWAKKDSSALVKSEPGSKFIFNFRPVDPASNIRFNEEKLKQNHQKDYEELIKLQGIQRDDCFRQKAVQNIRAHPLKYIKNCVSNAGRLLFNIPYSYKIETPRSLLRLPISGILVFLLLICSIPTIKNWRNIPGSVRFLILFSLIYLGGSILLSAQNRMLNIVVPILLVWVAYVIEKSVKFDFNQNDKPTYN